MKQGSNGKRKRNTAPLTFGAAVDKLEAMASSEAREREVMLATLAIRQQTRRLRVLDRCDAETKSRVIRHLEPDVGDAE